MKTDFQKVLEFNKAFGAILNNKPQHNIFDINPLLVQNRLELITEEYNELLDAIKAKSLDLVVDSCIDQIYVLWGCLQAFGIQDGDKAFDLVHQSNMTKFCKDENEAKLSIEKYKKEGRYIEPSYKLSSNGLYIIYDKDTNKILKSINYKPVDLSTIL